MKTRNFLSSILVLGLMLLCIANFAACGNSSGNTIAVSPPVACAAGQANTQFGCLNTTSCSGSQMGWGFYPTTNQCYPPVLGTGVGIAGLGQPGQWGGALTGITQQIFGSLLRDSGACDPYNLANFFLSNCKHYTGSGYITIYYSGASTVNVQIIGGSSNPNYIGLMTIASGVSPVVISRSLQIVPYGNGLQMSDALGGLYGNGALNIIDNNESFNSRNLNLILTYGNQNMARAMVVN